MLIEVTHKDKKFRYGNYRCDFCGSMYVTRVRPRKNDNCGCHHNALKHGEEVGGKPSPELKVYRKMRERCLSEACPDYVNYGGRGIKICDRWLASYDDFLADMGRRPTVKHTIERRDVHGDYCPENCYWLPKKLQAKNTRSNVHIEIKGESKILTDWLKHFSIARTSFYRELKRCDDCHMTALSKWVEL